ncbi:serine O-acetyltransferase EpsC [uncultured Treponema sp.]|uniref:serine O-acetyltransferase EpsC n=1 Tax=uncultured Treponema sp. TaxID=162155 RepID=UPI00280B65D7|nr:serine O-acetyltransferase EpsC [uncultured Treponema sp.]
MKIPFFRSRNVMDMHTLVDKILDSYEKLGGINGEGINSFPNRENVVCVINELQSLIFPGYRTAEDIDRQNLRYVTGERVNKIVNILTKEIQKALIYKKSTGESKACETTINDSGCREKAEKTALGLIEALPEIRRLIRLDVNALFEGDPAAKSDEEVIVSYPGLEAITVYRLAHYIHKCGVPVIPRIMSEYIHGKTGIDIHPGAEIGESFFIDHGTGIVIGETSVIGKNVKIYQGVTLGALSVKKKYQDKKRHPTIEDDVTIYANATILGGETVIGKGAVIGGNTWIIKSVPAGTIINQ